MPELDPALLHQLKAFGTSLTIGLLMGLERERRPEAKAGLRTFALVAMLGTLTALIADRIESGWIIALGLFVVGAMMIAASAADPSDNDDPGTTSVVALMLSYSLGVAVWYGYGTLSAMLGIAATALLYFKSELHHLTHSLTRTDLISILQLAALSFIVLPILPDHDFGPYDAFNLRQIWRMVVLISAVSLAGYAALRIVGARYGAAMVGFFGGLVSSTATTMVFSRHARSDGSLVRTATVVILIANLMVMLRLLVLSLVVAPNVTLALGIVFGTGLLLGVIVAALLWRHHGSGGELPTPEVSNPTEIRVAISFGLIYALVLFLVAWLQDLAGNSGVYAVALLSGLTDVDAITLSTLRLFNLGKMASDQAVLSIALAVLSNLVFKSGLIIVIGGGALARRTLPGFAAIAAGIIGALVLAPSLS